MGESRNIEFKRDWDHKIWEYLMEAENDFRLGLFGVMFDNGAQEGTVVEFYVFLDNDSNLEYVGYPKGHFQTLYQIFTSEKEAEDALQKWYT